MMSFNTFIRVGGGFLTGRSIGAGRDKSGPYECDVPVHNTLGISLKGINCALTKRTHPPMSYSYELNYVTLAKRK